MPAGGRRWQRPIWCFRHLRPCFMQRPDGDRHCVLLWCALSYVGQSASWPARLDRALDMYGIVWSLVCLRLLPMILRQSCRLCWRSAGAFGSFPADCDVREGSAVLHCLMSVFSPRGDTFCGPSREVSTDIAHVSAGAQHSWYWVRGHLYFLVTTCRVRQVFQIQQATIASSRWLVVTQPGRRPGFGSQQLLTMLGIQCMQLKSAV